MMVLPTNGSNLEECRTLEADQTCPRQMFDQQDAFNFTFPALFTKATQAFDASETSRTAISRRAHYITLNVCSEVHSLAQIVFILNGFRERMELVFLPPERSSVPHFAGQGQRVVPFSFYEIHNRNISATFTPSGFK